MKNKFLILLIFTSSFVFPATAAVTDVDVVNVYPDTNNRYRDTTVVARISSDSTVTTDVSLYVTKPDNTTFLDETKTINVKQNIVREVPFQIPDERVDQFGEYRFTVNETSNNVEGNFTIEIIPQPDADVDIAQNIVLNSQEFVTVNVNPIVGGSINFSEIQNPRIEVWSIDDDLTTPKVEKNLVYQDEMVEDLTTNDLEQNIDLENFTLGQYELNVKFNVSSCTSCENYTETESDVFRIQTDAMTNTAVIIGLGILPILLIMILREFRQAEDMMDEAVMTLLILFIIGLEYTGYGIAKTNSVDYAVDAYLVTLLVTVLAFFAVVIQLVVNYKEENREETLGGFSLSR